MADDVNRESLALAAAIGNTTRDIMGAESSQQRFPIGSRQRKLLHEWMHRFALPTGHVVRVWTGATPNGGSAEFDAQHVELREWIEPYDRHITEIATEIRYVNAVEVLDEDGNGRLVYVDWP